jgi:hypothetical protein
MTPLLALALSSCLFTAPGAAPTAHPADRVLTPDSARILRQALQRAKPHLQLRGARLQPYHVDLTLGLPGGGSASLRLSHPGPGCRGYQAGPWCVVEGSPALGNSERAALKRALAGDRLDAVWKRRDRNDSRSRRASTLETRPPPDAKPLPGGAKAAALALLFIALPLALGWGAGRAGRRLRGCGARSRWLLAALLLAAVVVGATLPWVATVAPWDLIAALLLLVWGLWIGLRDPALRWDRKNLALTAGSTTLSLLLMELLLRWLAPAPPGFAPPAGLIRMRDREVRSDWATLYPDAYPGEFARLTRAARAARVRVLHVGDSMVAAFEVRQSQRFVSLLDGPAGTAHVNAGVQGTGPDFHYLVIRRWTRRLRFHQVVQYVFPANDLIDLETPHETCPGGLLLRYGSGPPRARCAKPPEDPFSAWSRYRSAWRARPCPYPVLAAAGFSVLARHLCGLRLRRLLLRSPLDANRAMTRLARILRTTRALLNARGVAYTVVVLPYRGTLADRSHRRLSRSADAEVLALVRRLSIRTLDASKALRDPVRRQGPAPFFADDIHFNARGCRLVADWLKRRLAGTPGFSR